MWQILRRDGIEWPNHRDPKPETILGDLNWKNYVVGADAMIPPNGYIALLGRIALVPNNEKLPGCYCFKVSASGQWELRAVRTVVGPKP